MTQELMQVAQQALEALKAVQPYTDRLICYASTAAEHPANLIDGKVAEAIASLELVLQTPEAQEGFAQVKSPITEGMHLAACKVLLRSPGLDDLPQRMLDAMLVTQAEGRLPK